MNISITERYLTVNVQKSVGTLMFFMFLLPEKGRHGSLTKAPSCSRPLGDLFRTDYNQGVLHKQVLLHCVQQPPRYICLIIPNIVLNCLLGLVKHLQRESQKGTLVMSWVICGWSQGYLHTKCVELKFK